MSTYTVTCPYCLQEVEVSGQWIKGPGIKYIESEHTHTCRDEASESHVDSGLAEQWATAHEDAQHPDPMDAAPIRGLGASAGDLTP